MFKIVKDDIDYGSYTVTYYCYKSDCPPRTKDRPWPRSDAKFVGGKILCEHCGAEMTGTANPELENLR